ncbi:TPA: LysR family transcriptional regulator [Klebsiella variicola]|uniref:LysR family transcriptional regulator n=1 Tax=Klebsiella pneumoniae TaxID=573 RepID=UPI0015EA8B30|nr:LysR family transcriptional regulator [Klebsiella pneumoniae]EIY5386275.1 LysR family transcriptional regulator [Klebsiella variicola]MDU4203448.1 LysR family transcriptional regulator [Negativicoccus succinicivorans]MDU4248812.1 LysR family transcriptional regulator [Thomasclavelia ramosa]QLR70900.1 LysR family transcriptional regulator [Klebsiella pneumoniae]QLR70984.1 LysR family transcriptional regulator [Klebsiella pneumoniae]
MIVSDIDLRLLKVFKMVVEANGFSNAQTRLNVSQSTISAQMSQLEVRLGFILCQRGRSGFQLTAKGKEFYHYTLQFFQSLQEFQVRTTELKGGLTGTLRIGFLDNVITDPMNPLCHALEKLMSLPQNTIHLVLETLSPPELEKKVLDHSLDVAIGIFSGRVPGLNYQNLYTERDILVCRKDHPLVRVDSTQHIIDAIPRTPRVVRTFFDDKEFPIHLFNDTVSASVTNLEASAMLVLTGHYIGFFPQHFVQRWLDTGELVCLVPDQISRQSQFELIIRDKKTPLSIVLDAFLRCIWGSTANRVLSP